MRIQTQLTPGLAEPGLVQPVASRLDRVPDDSDLLQGDLDRSYQFREMGHDDLAHTEDNRDA